MAPELQQFIKDIEPRQTQLNLKNLVLIAFLSVFLSSCGGSNGNQPDWYVEPGSFPSKTPQTIDIRGDNLQGGGSNYFDPNKPPENIGTTPDYNPQFADPGSDEITFDQLQSFEQLEGN